MRVSNVTSKDMRAMHETITAMIKKHELDIMDRAMLSQFLLVDGQEPSEIASTLCMTALRVLAVIADDHKDSDKQPNLYRKVRVVHASFLERLDELLEQPDARKIAEQARSFYE